MHLSEETLNHRLQVLEVLQEVQIVFEQHHSVERMKLFFD